MAIHQVFSYHFLKRRLAHLVLAVLILPGLAMAAPGDLDLSFNSTGAVTTPIGAFSDDARSVAVQADGKIVLAGYSFNGSLNDFVVVRYNIDGSLDTSFGGSGIVITPIGLTNDALGWSVAIQADGRIVVAGYFRNVNDYDVAAVRYNIDGSLDTSFGGTGIVTIPIALTHERVRSVAIQADGKIVVAGQSWNGGIRDFLVLRFNSNGSLDTGFGSPNGFVTTNIGTSDYARSVKIQADGKIVVGGQAASAGDLDFAVVRYNINGSLDAGFGSSGSVTTDFGSLSDGAESVALQGDGKILVAGNMDNGGNRDFAVARYNSDGSLDTGFGGSGTVITTFGPGNDLSYFVAQQGDGKIVGAGIADNGSDSDFAVVRYNSDGSLDTGFGGGTGFVTTPIGSSGDFGLGGALQADGKILVAGSSLNGDYRDFAVARYLGDDPVTPGSSVSVPALPQWSMILLSLLLGLVAFFGMRKKAA